MPDADAHAAKLVADVRGDRAQPVVAGDPAAGLHAHLGRRKIELIVEHDDLARRELVEVRGLRHRAPGFIHVRAGQEQEYALAAERAFGCDALEAAAPRTEVMTAANGVDHHEADVVAVCPPLPPGAAAPPRQEKRSTRAPLR